MIFKTPTAQIDRAREIVKEAHKSQRYGGGCYYENHLAKVAKLVFNATDDIDITTVAYMHDLLEDTDWNARQLISEGFPVIVVIGVMAMTHEPDTSYMKYLMRMESTAAIITKYADMTANLSSNPRPKQVVKYTMGRDFFYEKHSKFRHIFDRIDEEAAKMDW